MQFSVLVMRSRTLVKLPCPAGADRSRRRRPGRATPRSPGSRCPGPARLPQERHTPDQARIRDLIRKAPALRPVRRSAPHSGDARLRQAAQGFRRPRVRSLFAPSSPARTVLSSGRFRGSRALSWGSQGRSGRIGGLASRFRLRFRSPALAGSALDMPLGCCFFVFDAGGRAAGCLADRPDNCRPTEEAGSAASAITHDVLCPRASEARQRLAR